MRPTHTVTFTIHEKEFVFETGYRFRGLTISLHPEGWNIILRGFDRKDMPVYCMVVAEDPGKGLEQLFWIISARGGKDVWRFDKWAR